jgi:hypothetical protein
MLQQKTYKDGAVRKRNYKKIGILIYHTTWSCIREGTDLKLVK